MCSVPEFLKYALPKLEFDCRVKALAQEMVIGVIFALISLDFKLQRKNQEQKTIVKHTEMKEPCTAYSAIPL